MAEDILNRFKEGDVETESVDTGKKVNYFGQKHLVFFPCSVTIIDSTDKICREHII